jgi:predicted porin
MQKKLIALAVAGMASTAAFAQSNVTIYGLIQPSYDFIDNGGSENVTEMANNNSRIGFKGEEALGNGLKAIFQIESGVSISSNRGESNQDGTFGGRDSFAGLAGSFGSITFGKHQTAYKKAADWADPFADTIADYNNIMGTIGDGADEFNGRHSRSTYYTSPNWGGFNLVASYAQNNADGLAQGASDELCNDGGVAVPCSGAVSAKGTKADNILSIAGTYKWGGLNLLAGWQENGQVGTGDELEAWKLGAGYKFSFGTQLNGIYEQVKLGDWDKGQFYLSAVHPITGNVDLMAAYIQADGSRHLGGDGKNYSLGASYKLSKRTSVQGIYTHLKNGDNGGYGLDAGYSVADGNKVSGFSVRLRHAF